MGARLEVPAGFAASRSGRIVRVVRLDLSRALAEAGLDAPDGWERRLAGGARGPGRGAVARVDLEPGIGIVLKRLRRGGALAGLWRDRFAGLARLLANVTVPEEAARRGVPTPRPVALVAIEGPAGLYRAFLALEAVPGSIDLLTRLGRPPAVEDDDLVEVLATVRRMHDAGVDHRDLNLGNLLVAVPPARPRDAVHVIDLDRAALRPGPLPFRRRLAALRRLERSYDKNFPEPGAHGRSLHELWYEAYAGADDALRARLSRARPGGRLSVRMHRLGRAGRGRRGRTP